MNPQFPVVFTDINQLNFIKKLFTDYKNNAGEYIFEGPMGNNPRIGSFPSNTGSANSNFEGTGSFPEAFYQTGANIFNDILLKLGDVVEPPLNPVSHSPGEE